MIIADVLAVPVRSGFFTDDQAAIRAGAVHDGFIYRGRPATAGFGTIRQPGEAVSVLLLLDDGQIAHGDCAAVQYSGVGGRAPLFTAGPAVEAIERHVAPLLRGRELSTFRDVAREVDTLAVDGAPLHAAVRYGVTQALLDAVARWRGVTMAEVVRDEYETGIPIRRVPMFVQSGDDRRDNVDKMVLKEADVLPHGLINEVETKLGRDGELLLEYVAWVRDRIIELRTNPGYSPRLYFDVYGTVGVAFDCDLERVAAYLARLGDVAKPFGVCVEQVIDAGSRSEQIRVSAALRTALRDRGSDVQIAVDEWCNTLEDIELFVSARAADVIHVKTPDLGGVNNVIEALLLVARNGLSAYCGGSCNETDRSAQVSAHIAMACGAAQVLAKPGMGVDEGMMIVGNEMARVAALVAARGARAVMRPLADVRIIAIEQYAAGPFGSVQLADLGADVIKIEDPATGGDVGRYVPPLQEGEDSLFFETFNRNKRSIGLDLKAPDGRSVFEDLVRVSDVVYSNLRGDVPHTLRINYDDLKHLNPAIVCCALTGFGMTGSRRSEPGYDYFLQGIAGWMDITGEPSGPPAKSGLSLVDYSSGLVAAIAVLAGVHAARRDGVGMDCDVSLFDTALAMLTYPAIWNLNGDFTPTRTHHSAHPSLVPFQAFQTRDGWIVVGCAKEKFWVRLTIAIDRPELASDARFASFADRLRNSAELLPMLETVFASRTAAEWLDVLGRAGVPCSPVNTVPEALRDEQTTDRGMIVETEHPRFGTVRQLRSPVRVGAVEPEYVRAPLRDEHRDWVLGDLLGYDATRIAELNDGGAFGRPGQKKPG